MKKVIVMIVMLLLLPCMQVSMAAHAQTVIMGGQYIDPSDEKAPNHRMPAAPIYVSQDEHAFTFNASIAGETIEVVSGDEILYTTIIGEDGTVVIPDSISGEVELRLYRGSLVYHAEVEL